VHLFVRVENCETGEKGDEPIPDSCEKCGLPFGPDADVIVIREVVVHSREEAERVRRLNEENGHE
jgi:hypothetical protein